MKLPWDVSGKEAIKALRKLGYAPVRQKGSQVVLIGPKGNMIVVPLHKRLKTGLLRAIIREVGISVKELLSCSKILEPLSKRTDFLTSEGQGLEKKM